MAIVAERLDECAGRRTKMVCSLSALDVSPLSFKEEGAGKVRVFAIPNALKQALFRPAHDWCMKI